MVDHLAVENVKVERAVVEAEADSYHTIAVEEDS